MGKKTRHHINLKKNQKLTEKQNKIVDALSNGLTAEQAADMVGVDRSYAQAINAREKPVIEAKKAKKLEDLLPALHTMAGSAIEQAIDRLPEASARDAAIVAGIGIEKLQSIQGLANFIVHTTHEHRDSLPDLAEVLLRIAEMKKSSALSGTHGELKAIDADYQSLEE